MQSLVRKKLPLSHHPGEEGGQLVGDGAVAADPEGGEHGQAGHGQVRVMTLMLDRFNNDLYKQLLALP